MKKAKSKWNVGDLVTLSAAGMSVDQNGNMCDFVDGKQVVPGFGMVIKIKGFIERWPVHVQWFSGKHQEISFKDYELKKFKVPK